MNSQKYKQLSVGEFTKVADRYESDNAGIYKMCKNDYPDILADLEKEEFTDLLDCGCGTGPMISLLHEQYPERNYTGLDLTPKMIEVANSKKLSNTNFIVGDCENLPFDENSFDAVICSQSFHHYPNPQKFFNSVCRVLRSGGRLILRDNTGSDILLWLINHIELPLCRLAGHGDVKVYKLSEVKYMCEKAGLLVETLEQRKGFRLHCVARKK